MRLVSCQNFHCCPNCPKIFTSVRQQTFYNHMNCEKDPIYVSKFENTSRLEVIHILFSWISCWASLCWPAFLSWSFLETDRPLSYHNIVLHWLFTKKLHWHKYSKNDFRSKAKSFDPSVCLSLMRRSRLDSLVKLWLVADLLDLPPTCTQSLWSSARVMTGSYVLHFYFPRPFSCGLVRLLSEKSPKTVPECWRSLFS